MIDCFDGNYAFLSNFYEFDPPIEVVYKGNYWKDTYWGVCNGVGENHLGKLLMKIREKLKEK